MLLCTLFLFNCSELYFSSLYCSNEDEVNGICERHGNAELLMDQLVDVLFVMSQSEEMQDLNPQISNSLRRFLKCMYPSKWQVGFIATVNSDSVLAGELMPLEHNGQLSTKHFIHSDMKDYEDLFNQSVSLNSGCELPPFCNKEGSATTLHSIKTFMENSNNRDIFFRKDTPLNMVVISPSVEKANQVPAESALSAVQAVYPDFADRFNSLTITAPGTKDDCIKTIKDSLSGGAKTISGVATAVGFASANPLVILGASLFNVITSMHFVDSEDATKQNIQNREAVRFSTLTGGRVLNICHPRLGEAIAFSILENIGMEDRISEECKDFDPHSGKLKSLNPSLEL